MPFEAPINALRNALQLLKVHALQFKFSKFGDYGPLTLLAITKSLNIMPLNTGWAIKLPAYSRVVQ